MFNLTICDKESKCLGVWKKISQLGFEKYRPSVRIILKFNVIGINHQLCQKHYRHERECIWLPFRWNNLQGVNVCLKIWIFYSLLDNSAKVLPSFGNTASIPERVGNISRLNIDKSCG